MRKVSLAELLYRGRQAVYSRLDGVDAWNRWTQPATDAMFSTGRFEPAVFEHLSMLFDASARPAVTQAKSDGAASRRRDCVAAAEMALAGRFDLLGHRGLDFGLPVDWHLEPTSGRRSPRIPWKQLDNLSTELTGDKKVVWELNRHQHLLSLGRAYLETGNEKFAAAVGEHIGSWIEQNPPERGINWVSSLELAFRCINWLWSLAFIRQSGSWESLPLKEISRSLNLQGRHIERHLSTYYSPNTHLTGEALGLYYLGTVLPGFRRSKHWRDMGRDILLAQLDVQIHPDGMYFEQATWYHRYTADFYLHFDLLARRSDDPLPPKVRDKLEQMLDYLMWITRPDGSSPYVGDDDGGALVKLDSKPPHDWRSTMATGAVVFSRPDYKHVAGEFPEGTYWLLGAGSETAFDQLRAAPPSGRSRAFPDGGTYVMRSGWEDTSNYLLIDCGPHGVMNYGHAHADALSLELAAHGKKMFVDPGTFPYSDPLEARDRFRATASHNTLTVDGLSSSVPAGPFKWQHVASSTAHYWLDHPGFSCFQGSQDGFMRLADPVMHTRTVLFPLREYWILCDRVTAEGGHQCETHFHLDPDARGVLLDDNRRLEIRAGSTCMDVIYADPAGSWQLQDDVVSPCFGASVTAQHASFRRDTTGPTGLLAVMLPRQSNQPPVRTRALESGQGMTIETGQFEDLVFWSGQAGAAEEQACPGDFEWTWTRRESQGGDFRDAALLRGSRVSLDGIDLHADRQVELVVVSRRDATLTLDVAPRATLTVTPPAGVSSVVINGEAFEPGPGESLCVRDMQMPEPLTGGTSGQHLEGSLH